MKSYYYYITYFLESVDFKAQNSNTATESSVFISKF